MPFAQANKHSAATKWTKKPASSGPGKKARLAIVTENSFVRKAPRHGKTCSAVLRPPLSSAVYLCFFNTC